MNIINTEDKLNEFEKSVKLIVTDINEADYAND